MDEKDEQVIRWVKAAKNPLAVIWSGILALIAGMAKLLMWAVIAVILAIFLFWSFHIMNENVWVTLNVVPIPTL